MVDLQTAQITLVLRQAAPGLQKLSGGTRLARNVLTRHARNLPYALRGACRRRKN
jgi:hypothetical protein